MTKVAKLVLVLVMGLLLTVGATLVTGQGKGDKARCLAACKDKCTKSYNSCMKDAKTDPAKQACGKSRDLCNSDCVNKACQ